jgi:predicted DNA-binding transcriptional regulator YafY
MTKTQRHLLIIDILRREGPLGRDSLRRMLSREGATVSERTFERDETELQCSGRIVVGADWRFRLAGAR